MTAAEAPGRPATGTGHYLRDIVYGALDGVITTLAVVAGVSGASLSVEVALILGLANLAADGISMGASNYLGLKSELEQTGQSVAEEEPWRHGMATFAAFVVAGAVPLASYALPFDSAGRLAAASLLSAIVLLAVGAARARFLPRSATRYGIEMLVIGVIAAAAAFAVGAGVEALVQ
jgi:VIT1/CCC1 family predicted Fe2+/Mn2+ transporter